jgi:hypothetical protein
MLKANKVPQAEEMILKELEGYVGVTGKSKGKKVSDDPC